MQNENAAAELTDWQLKGGDHVIASPDQYRKCKSEGKDKGEIMQTCYKMTNSLSNMEELI
jgi:hypothetical protein